MFYLISCVFSFLSSVFPLFFPVGQNLEYEYTVLGLFFLYAFFFLGSFLIPKKLVKQSFSGIQKKPWRFVLLVFLIAPLVFFTTPFFLLKTNTCLCSESHFYRWFFLNLYPAFVLAHGFFYYVFLGRFSKAKKRKILWVASFFPVFCLVQSVLFFWIFPQKRQTHFLWGHLHGPIYDFVISYDAGIVLARMSHFFLAGAFLLFLLKKKNISGFLFACFISLYLASFNYPSTQFGIKALEKNFTGKHEGKGYVLFYNEDSQEKKRVEIFKKEVLFHLDEIEKLLSLVDKATVKIFVYDSYKQKKLLFGASQTDVTDIFTPSIHLGSLEFPHRSLRHELVHALMAKESLFGLGFHPNMALTEGIAVALAPEAGVSSLHKGAAHLLHHQKIDDVKNLFSPFFWRYAGSRAYTISGSLIQFLIEQKGSEAVKKMYKTFGLQEALGAEEDRLLSEWADFIELDYSPMRDDLVHEKFYRYPGLLNDKCPHSKAEMSYDENLDSKDFLTWKRTLNPNDSKAFLQDLRFDLNKERKLSEERFLALAEEKIKELASFEKNKRSNYDYYEIKLQQCDLLRIVHKQKQSLEILKILSDKLKKASLGESLTRQIQARVLVEEEADAKLSYYWRRYLSGYGPIPSLNGKETNWIFDYLKFRFEYYSKRSSLEKDFSWWEVYFNEKKIPEPFLKEWVRLLAIKRSHIGDFKNAKAFWHKLSLMTEGRNKDLYQQYRRMISTF